MNTYRNPASLKPLQFCQNASEFGSLIQNIEGENRERVGFLHAYKVLSYLNSSMILYMYWITIHLIFLGVLLSAGIESIFFS